MSNESAVAPPWRVRVEFPAVFAIDECWEGNTIQQLVQPSCDRDVVVEEYRGDQVEGYRLTPTEGNDEPVLAIANDAEPPAEFTRVLRLAPDSLVDGASVPADRSTWIRHPKLTSKSGGPIDFKKQTEEAINSWQGAFLYQEEDPQSGTLGLRPPQIGAVHAVHAHWAISSEPATVTMPTGTGKTETMLSILVSAQCRRLLVVVPTAPLRSQISAKFLTFGVLRTIGVLKPDAHYPVVGVLNHMLSECDDVDYFFEKCSVIVTTMHIPGRCGKKVQERMAYHCPFLFIDEAHHVAAKTWRTFKRRFGSGRILQFTATPFRNDGKSIGGKIIFNYPLGKAQEDGYFRPITFAPVREFDPSKADRAIANRAIAQLISDWPYGHILMARVESCRRAEEEVFPIYREYRQLPAYQEYLEHNPGNDLELNPVEIHTGIAHGKREATRRRILSAEARVIVCVDMLGEGFDLPELKIAAFHDVKKSLPVTLQLAGRFTRTKAHLGEPTFIANIADVDVRDELESLYSQDADWNALLRQSSEEAIQEQERLWKFIEGFTDLPKDIPLQNIRPPGNIVIYRTECKQWTPEEYSEGLRSPGSLERVYHGINPEEKVLVIVAARKASVDWAQIEEVFTITWELYVAFWNDAQQLLYFATADGGGYCKKLAKAIAGEDVRLVRDPHVFRCFSGINRLRFYNVGLSRRLGRLVRYEMRAGADVGAVLTSAQMRDRLKSNLAGGGYEGGERTYIGCSRRGKIWSLGALKLDQLTAWCNHVGRKILDESIDFDHILKGTLIPVTISQRPQEMPIAIEWPEAIYKRPESAYRFSVGGQTDLPLFHMDIDLKHPSQRGELRFEIRSEAVGAEFVLTLRQPGGVDDYRFMPLGSQKASIQRGENEWTVEEFFYDHPPVIWFSDGSSLEGNTFVELRKAPEPYPRAEIKAWDWTGIDLATESQGIEKREDSIQYRVIEHLKQGVYDIIYDDDDKGEAADVIGIRLEKGEIVIEFYHCKYTSRGKGGVAKPGVKIGDLYEVCGQAQKSIHWKRKPAELFEHLKRREPRRKGGREGSRFEEGSSSDIERALQMSEICPVSLRIFIVQPGLSRAKASIDQLQLLGVTQNYLMETYELPFGAIASP